MHRIQRMGMLKSIHSIGRRIDIKIHRCLFSKTTSILPSRKMSGIAYIQVANVGSDDCSASAMLFVFGSRFAFNCGEGTQRFYTEHGLHPSKLTRIFLTQSKWSAMGGLPGMTLTLADLGCSGIDVYGASPLRSLYDPIQPFCGRDKFSLKLHEVDNMLSSGERIEDSHVHFRPCILQPSYATSTSTSTSTSASASTSESTSESTAATVSSMSPDMNNQSSKRQRAMLNISVCYAAHIADKPGKFDNKKATALKVPFSVIRKQLVDGFPITLADGTIVRPEDCIGAAQPGPVILIIDCASLEHLASLNSSSWLKNYVGKGSFASQVSTVMHLSPGNVASTSEYKAWMRTMEWCSSVKHVLVNENVSGAPLVFRRSARQQIRLNVLNDSIHPLCDTEPPISPIRSEDFTGINVCAGLPLESVFVRAKPTESFKGRVDPLNFNDIRKEVLNLRCINDIITPANVGKYSESQERWPEISFLGTGAAIPSNYRNVSSTLIRTDESSCALFDAGEGTVCQLQRLHGREGMRRILSQLQCVFISHMHADHHLGLINVLRLRSSLFPEANPLTVVGPQQLKAWLRTYSTIEPLGDYIFEDARKCTLAKSEHQISTLGANYEMVPVIHSHPAFGLVLTDVADKWKLVFSGDTRPCPALAKAGRGATLLVHEATFDDNLLHEAKDRRHSTTGEALNIAQDMQAEFTLLTHFSQRYPHCPAIVESMASHVGIAFDLMTVRPCDLPTLSRCVKAIPLLFPVDDEESDEELL